MGDLNTQKNQKLVNPLGNKLNKFGHDESDLVMPKAIVANVKTTDSEVTLSRNEKGTISVSAPKNSKFAILYKTKDSEDKISETIAVKVDEKISMKDDAIIKYRVLDEGNLQVVADKNVVNLEVAIKKESGVISKIDILKSFKDVEVKSKLPEDILEIAKSKNYDENLIKKDNLGNYTYCLGDTCLMLGKSKLESGDKTLLGETSNSSLVVPQVSSKKEEQYSTMSSVEARLYLQSHPNENVFVVITAPTWCDPCKEYEPRIGPIAEGLKGIAKLIVVNQESNPTVDQDFRVKGYPTTLLFPGNRQKPLTSEVRFSGAQKLENLKEKLEFVLKRK